MQIERLFQSDITANRYDLILLLKICMEANFPCPVSEFFYEEKLNGLEKYLRNEKAYVFVAKENGRIVGFIWSCILATSVGQKMHVLYFAVLPELQGKGIGAELLNMAETVAQHQCISQMELIVSSSNHASAQFYENKGYQPERLILTKRIT